MRHAGRFDPFTVGALTLNVRLLSGWRGLVPPCSRNSLLPPHSRPTGSAAIPLATIAALADREHGVAGRVITPADAERLGLTVFVAGRRHDSTTIRQGRGLDR
jgi:hypothetical protein